jgi:hypothetical protein
MGKQGRCVELGNCGLRKGQGSIPEMCGMEIRRYGDSMGEAQAVLAAGVRLDNHNFPDDSAKWRGTLRFHANGSTSADFGSNPLTITIEFVMVPGGRGPKNPHPW